MNICCSREFLTKIEEMFSDYEVRKKFFAQFNPTMNTDQPPTTNEFVAPGCELFTPRALTDHKTNGLNGALVVEALNAPGPGGACEKYGIRLVHNLGSEGVPSYDVPLTRLEFQNQPIKSAANFNGITNEALLAVLIDRMRGFQSGKFACRENALALTHLEESLMWLQKRTRERMTRGVEGSHSK